MQSAQGTGADGTRLICLVRVDARRPRLVGPVRSAGVCGYNATPAARTHSAPFSEGNSPMAFVCFGLMAEWLSTHASLMLLMRLINSLNLHLPHAFLRDPSPHVNGNVCSV